MQERVKPKTRVTLDLDTALVAAAATGGLDLAALLEQVLEARVGRSRMQRLSGEEHEVAAATDRYVAEHGSWVVDWQKL